MKHKMRKELGHFTVSVGNIKGDTAVRTMILVVWSDNRASRAFALQAAKLTIPDGLPSQE